MSEELVQSNGNNGGFSIEEVELGLRLTVLSGGDTGRAAKLMKNEGHPVDSRTLRKWKDETHALRYEQLVPEIRQQLNESVGDVSLVIAEQAQAVEQDMLKELAGKINGMEGKELARGVSDLARASNTHIATNRLLNDKPTSITRAETSDERVTEALAALKDLDLIEGTATEIDEEGEQVFGSPDPEVKEVEP